MMQYSETDSGLQERTAGTLLSDEPTIELVIRAQAGDPAAVEALLQRCLPRLKRWAHGRLPAVARGQLDTGDLVQDAALHVLGRIHIFKPKHVGAMHAYLRRAVINRICDEVRRVSRQPPPVELPQDYPSEGRSPLEVAIQAETYERYRAALTRLTPRDREMVVARIELQWSFVEIAQHFGPPSVNAARMAVMRALQRLTERLES